MRATALEARVEEVLALFDITGYADRPNDRLSTGMKQRVGLARAVVHDPPVLILDEPTTRAGPDRQPHGRAGACSSLARRGKCVLFSTHLLAQAEDICTASASSGSGRVLARGRSRSCASGPGTANLRAGVLRAGRTGADDGDVAPLDAADRGFDATPPDGGTA